MNPDELAALAARVDAADPPPEICLCCSRGHFIIAVKLAARLRTESDNSDPALMMWPAVGRRHHLGERAVIESNSGFVVENGPNGQTVTLSCDRCPRWTPTRNYQRLAVKAAVYALAGHREYWL